MKQYYDRVQAPLAFHFFYRFIGLPLGFLTRVTELQELLTMTTDNNWLVTADIIFCLLSIGFILVCFIGFFGWKPYAWYGVMGYLCMQLIYLLAGGTACAILFPEMAGSFVGKIIGALISAPLMGIYYIKRKPLFFAPQDTSTYPCSVSYMDIPASSAVPVEAYEQEQGEENVQVRELASQTDSPDCGADAVEEQKKAEHAINAADKEKRVYSPYDVPDKKSRAATKWLVVALIVAFLIIVALCVVLFTRNNNKDKPEESDIIETVETGTEETQTAPMMNTEPAKEEKVENTDALAAAAGSVLYLEVYDEQGKCFGTATGFLVKDDTTLVTSYHVVRDACRIDAWTPDNQHLEANTILAYDKVADLVVLRCDAPAGKEPLTLADSDGVKQTMSVYAVGYPLGVANTISDGIISARYIDSYGNDTLQTTAAISNGNSGGPLLNEDGEVIGVICAYYVDGQNLNVAIASNTLRAMLEEDFQPVELSAWDKRPDKLSGCPHVYMEWIVEQEPTCTERGQGSRACRLCGEIQTKELPPAGHTEVVDPEKKPTCAASGLSEGRHCSVCGEVLVEQTAVAETGHTFSGGLCSVCGMREPGNLPVLNKDKLVGIWGKLHEGDENTEIEVFLFREDGMYARKYIPSTDGTTVFLEGGSYEIDGNTITFYPFMWEKDGVDYIGDSTAYKDTVRNISADYLYFEDRMVYVRIEE